jgi:iron complex transport system substrate-binding protein
LAEPGKGAASKEVLISTRPDFVLVTYFTYDLDPSNGAASAADYQAAGAQAYGMGTDAPCLPTGTQPSMQTIYADIRNLGAIFGVPERAEALIGQMQARIDAVQQKIAGLPPVKAIYYEDGTGPFTIYGDGLATEILTLAGGENVLKDQPAYTQVGQEVIAATNAEYWVMTEYPGFAPTAERAKMLYTTFPNLPASQNKRSIGINGAEAGVGIRLPGVIETLARAFHPEAFK